MLSCVHSMKYQSLIQDIANKKFGRWYVIEYAGHAEWKCICECGTQMNVAGYSLRKGKSLSCGCLRYEICSEVNKIHGMTKSPEYKSHQHLISRCFNVNDKNYSNYGGRGITVTPRWLGKDGFKNFFSDMGNRPSPKHSIDRYPNNETGNYEPSNCRWGTKPEQDRNKRNNHWLEYNGIKIIMTDLAKKLGIGANRIHWLLKSKTIDEVIDFLEIKDGKEYRHLLNF